MENIKEKIGETLEEKRPKKFRHFIVLLYEDSKTYNCDEVLRICKSQKKWAYIKHFPESNEKKEHIHMILSFENAKSKKTLSNQLGVAENYIDEIKSFRTICRYLVHKDDEDKIQYPISSVNVSKCFYREYMKQFDDVESEDEIINNIYIFIEGLKGNHYFKALRILIQYINLHCYDRIYKRYRFEFQEYLKIYCN